MTYEIATRPETEHTAAHTMDDEWESYEHEPSLSQYAPTVSTELGEQDPPPPYAP